MKSSYTRTLALLGTVAFAFGCSSGSSSAGEPPVPTSGGSGDDSGPRIIQPGAPGQAGRTFSAEELAAVEGVSYVQADVDFMQGMIPHHRQALEMTALVRQHATTTAVQQMALRMEISQRDEIAMMQTWLRTHGEATELPGMNGMHMMPGMLTHEQMTELTNARGIDFDLLFLEGMIQHHRGALTMVGVLFNTSGAAQESTIFKFAEDVDADQLMEIERMQGILNQIRSRGVKE